MQESDLSADELMQELRAQLTKLMSGQPGPYSVSYRYEAQGHLIHTSRRIFSHQEEIETTHNPYGDIESEIERRTLPPDSSSFSEARHSYMYNHQADAPSLQPRSSILAFAHGQAYISLLLTSA